MDLAHKSLGRVGMTSTEKMVVFASSLGTVFEWYDFFLVGALASEISRHFFPASIQQRHSSSRCSALRRALPYALSARSYSAGSVIWWDANIRSWLPSH